MRLECLTEAYSAGGVAHVCRGVVMWPVNVEIVAEDCDEGIERI